MSVTLKQIAAKTGLSIPTVHQILNGYNVSFAEATRKKVIDAAAELNYRPNITARSLVTQRSFLIGVLFYGPNNMLVTPFMRGVQQTVKQNRCSPLFLTHDTRAEELENLQSVLDRRVDGLIVNTAVDADYTTNAERFTVVEKAGTPIVEVFGRFIAGVPKVTLDFHTAATQLTRQLIADGHTHIALLIGDTFDEIDAQRVGGRFWSATAFFQGYQSEIVSAGLKSVVCKYPVGPNYSSQDVFTNAFAALPSLFRKPASSPTAIICYAEAGADAVVSYVDRLDEKFGGPFTVAAAQQLRRPISGRVNICSMPFPTERAGRCAAEAIFQRIAGGVAADVPLAPNPEPLRVEFDVRKHRAS